VNHFVSDIWGIVFPVSSPFGISTEDGKRIIYRLGGLLMSEHETLFGSNWRQVFGQSCILKHLLWKRLYVRDSNFQENQTYDGSRTSLSLFFIYNTFILYYLVLSLLIHC
jgi:hypothetical protein